MNTNVAPKNLIINPYSRGSKVVRNIFVEPRESGWLETQIKNLLNAKKINRARKSQFKNGKNKILETSASSLTHQIVALFLITLGILLIFQNFGRSINSANIVVQAQQNISNLKEVQIESDIFNLNSRANSSMTVNPVNPDTFKQPQEIIAQNAQIEEAKKDELKAKEEVKQLEVANKTPVAKKAVVPKAGTTTIKIKEGDTLGAIALKYDTTSQKLLELNGLKDQAKLKIGANLLVPDIAKPETAKTVKK